MIVWGGEGPQGRPNGAAYNPTSDRWRQIAQGPLGWTAKPTSLWVDEEWVIAVTRRESIQVAAYDPAGDSWRALPSIPGSFTSDNWLASTGSELLLVNAAGGTFRLPVGASDWLPGPAAEALGPIVSASGRVFGMAISDLSSPLREWTGESWNAVSPPPRPASNPVSFEDRIIPLGGGLILGGGLMFDVGSGQWFDLIPPPSDDRVDHVTVATDERLVIWGGWPGGLSRPFDFGVALTFERT